VLILCVLVFRISCGVCVLVCVLESVLVLRGFDLWSLRRWFLCCICTYGFGVYTTLYTTVVLLTMDAVTSETCRAKNCQGKRILYIQLDLNKTYVTKMCGTTDIKFI
jgi:hypothetical protein